MRLVLAVAVLMVHSVSLSSPAKAQPASEHGAEVGGVVDAPSGWAGCATNGTCTGEVLVGYGGGGPGAGASPCRWRVGDFGDIFAYVPAYLNEATELPEGPWVIVRCPVAGLGVIPVDFFALGEPPDVSILREMAERAVVVPSPATTFSPARAAGQVVGMETWLWIDPAATVRQSAVACVGPFDYACVSVSAAFVSIGADMGDGSDPVDCEGPGVAYDPDRSEADQRGEPHCGHVYTHVPRDGDGYTVRVAAEWFVTWSCSFDADGDGARESSCGGGALPPLVRLAEPVELPVGELQAVAIPNE